MSEQQVGQYVAYTFFQARPDGGGCRSRSAPRPRTPSPRRSRSSRPASTRSTPTRPPGVRPDCDFFFWKITPRYEDLGEFGAALNATPLAGWLDVTYNYLATTKASQYTSARRAAADHARRARPYLVVYPFVKLRPWYALPEEDRQRAMDEHMRIGDEHPSIHNHTTYSFGIDDQEFMTASSATSRPTSCT